MTSYHRSKVVLATDPLPRGDLYVEWLDRLNIDLELAKRFEARNPRFGVEVRQLEKAIRVLHDTWHFAEIMPNVEFYTEEIESAHRTVHVDRDGPIPVNYPTPTVGGSRNPRATGDKGRK